MKLSLSILSIAALVCLSTQARADLVGDTINYGEYNGATKADFSFALGTITAPGSNDVFGFTTTITGNTITITEDAANSTTCNTFNPGDVCGLVFTDITKNPGFAGITLDPSSTTNKLTGSIANGNVYLDFTNIELDEGDIATFDLTFNPSATPAVPEPGSLLLLSTGALGLAGALRKRMFGR